MVADQPHPSPPLRSEGEGGDLMDGGLPWASDPLWVPAGAGEELRAFAQGYRISRLQRDGAPGATAFDRALGEG